MLFTAYASSLFNVISNYMMSGYGYADDTQLLKFFSPKLSDQNESLKNVEDCLASVQAWMLKHKLKLNDGKTEVILFGSRQQLEKINMHHVKVGSNEINIVDNVRSLGFWLDSRLSMETHVNHICKRVNYSLHNLRRIRKYLTQGATECLVHSLITSHLDYVNSVMYGMPQFLFDKLQRLQNNAARLVLGLRKYDRISQSLRDLHWLPVRERVQFKILLLIFKVLQNKAPVYLTDLIVRSNSTYSLPSRNSLTLDVPRSHNKLNDRAFAVAGPTRWNSLPHQLRRITSENEFKSAIDIPLQ